MVTLKCSCVKLGIGFTIFDPQCDEHGIKGVHAKSPEWLKRLLSQHRKSEARKKEGE